MKRRQHQEAASQHEYGAARQEPEPAERDKPGLCPPPQRQMPLELRLPAADRRRNPADRYGEAHSADQPRSKRFCQQGCSPILRGPIVAAALTETKDELDGRIGKARVNSGAARIGEPTHESLGL